MGELLKDSSQVNAPNVPGQARIACPFRRRNSVRYGGCVIQIDAGIAPIIASSRGGSQRLLTVPTWRGERIEVGGPQLGRLADLAVPGLESITCETRQKNLKLFQRAALRSRQRASQGATACLQRFGRVALVKQRKTQSEPARAKGSILGQGLSIGTLRVLESERRKVSVGDPAMSKSCRRRVRSSLVEPARLGRGSQVQESECPPFRFVPGNICAHSLERGGQFEQRPDRSSRTLIRDGPDRSGDGRVGLVHAANLVDSRQGQKRGDVACTLLERPTIASRRLRPREPRRRVPGIFQVRRPLRKVRSQTPTAVP